MAQQHEGSFAAMSLGMILGSVVAAGAMWLAACILGLPLDAHMAGLAALAIFGVNVVTAGLPGFVRTVLAGGIAVSILKVLMVIPWSTALSLWLLWGGLMIVAGIVLAVLMVPFTVQAMKEAQEARRYQAQATDEPWEEGNVFTNGYTNADQQRGYSYYQQSR